MTTQLRTLLLTVLISNLMAYPVNAETAANAFDKLKALAGTWKEVGSKKDFKIQFELTAGDSVLMESWFYAGKRHSLTVYHLDGARLLATHYCPQGNQPRLQWQEGNNPKLLHFTFMDATNLADVHQSHQHELSFYLSRNDRLSRSETYLENSQPNEDVLTLEKADN